VLPAGFKLFQIANNPRNARDLLFSTAALRALEAAMAPADRKAFPLVFGPQVGGRWRLAG
jgi:hypothetical protein